MKMQQKHDKDQNSSDPPRNLSAASHRAIKQNFTRVSGWTGDHLLLCTVDKLVLIGSLVARSDPFVLPQHLHVFVKLLQRNDIDKVNDKANHQKHDQLIKVCNIY